MVYSCYIALAPTGFRSLKINLSIFLSVLSKEQNMYFSEVALGFGNTHKPFRLQSIHSFYMIKNLRG